MKIFGIEITRARKAPLYNVLRQEDAGVTLAQQKDVSLRTGYPAILFNYDGDNERVTDAYTQSPAVFAAVKVKATNVAQVPYEIYPIGGEDGDPISSGPVYDLFDSVNDNMNRYQLWESIVTYMDLRGHAPIRKSDEAVRGVPVSMYPLNPDSVKIRIVNGYWAGIEHRMGNGTEPEFIPRDQIIMPKYFNPKHPVKGLAPLEAARLGIENDYQAVLYNREFFKRGSAPGTIYTTEETFEDHQYERLKKDLIDNRKGKHHQDLLLDGGLKPMPHISQKDMEYLNLRRYSLEEIGRVFGVPKTKLMQDNDINYATARIFEIAFWQDTLIPLMRLIEEAFNKDLLIPLGYKGKFNTDAIGVLNEQVLDKAQAAQIYSMMGISLQDINERLGLGFPEQDSINAVATPESQPEEPEETEERSVKELPKPISTDMALSSMREVKWNSLMNRINPTVGRMRKEVKSYFRSIKQRLYNKLVKGAGENAVLKEIPTEPRSALQWVDDILSDKELRDTVRPLLLEGAGVGFDSVDVDVPFARDARLAADERILAAVAGRVTNIGRVNETLSDDVKQAIRDAISQGIEEGLPQDAKARLVLDAVGHQLENAESRVSTIARTETHGAFADGRRQVYDITKPIGLRWISARDDRVRDSHMSLDGQVVRYGNEFKPGLKDVYDAAAPPEEIINCRCVTVPIFNEDELDG